ncbi:MAG: methyl-accepting chemotaxis protein, partial [Alteromonadales bacterium]|nr:methyl-accepting chemotaxis protein [Alteromonadales bacterium]
MGFLRKFTIQKRLSMLVTLIVIGLIAIDVISLSEEYHTLLEGEKHTVKELVNSTHSIIEHHYALYQNGELSEEQAKEQALSIIANIRYGNSNYFWINDYTPNMIMHP